MSLPHPLTYNGEMKQIRQLILDMDGVLWRGETALPGLVPFFETLDRLGIRYVLATNNATKIATQYTEKLERLGVTVDPGCILTSAEATAVYLADEYPAGTDLYVIGEEGLQEALTAKGFRIQGRSGLIGPDASVSVVVVGFDRTVTYKELASAALLVRRGARLIGTNPDKTFPHELGLLPGAGSTLAFLEAATDSEPLIVGKPGQIVFREALRRLNARPEETAMIGDRLDTDIAGAKAAGIATILLLTGVTRPEHLADSKIQPDLVLADLPALGDYLAGQQDGR